jgi:hypothetical protein
MATASCYSLIFLKVVRLHKNGDARTKLLTAKLRVT